MRGRDRLINVAVFAVAGICWLAAALLFVNRSPEGDPGVQLLAGSLVGLALGATTAPLFWLLGYARQRRISYRGDWVRAARRGAWVGLVAALYVVLRAQGSFNPAIAAFVICLVVVVELALSAER